MKVFLRRIHFHGLSMSEQGFPRCQSYKNSKQKVVPEWLDGAIAHKLTKEMTSWLDWGSR